MVVQVYCARPYSPIQAEPTQHDLSTDVGGCAILEAADSHEADSAHLAREQATELCLDPCTGDITSESDVSLFAHAHFGSESFNQSYTFGYNWQIQKRTLMRFETGAVLKNTGWCCQ